MFPVRHDPAPGVSPARCAPAALACAIALALALPMPAMAADAMRVVRDPVTGELRGPTAAEAAAFEKAEAQLRAKRGEQPAQPVEIRHPDGSVETKLGEDTRMYSVVRANEDGTLAMTCLPAAQAEAFVKSSTSTFAARPAAKASHAKQP
jgi:hypothetical protein